MNDLNELFKEIPIADIAKELGEPESDVRAAVATALPALVGGMQENAKDPAAAASLAQALAKKDGSVIDGGINLGDFDAEEGAKIASHVFGGNTDDVMSALGSTNSGGSDLVKKVVAIIAPIVLAWLAKKMLGSDDSSGGGMLEDMIGGALGGGSSSGGLGDLLGGVLGGAMSGGGSSSGGGDDVLGDVLGSVLSGAGGGSSSGGLGDLLGGLLGGGSR